ncbi:NAD(P)-dependent dehydrogenase, short-chain alcohol dehydrogenase family [Sphingomonas laterariae]|uniref:NAD(P)-dependent dehydrogenase, short-chain alcohol dehydrogenase family n=1 Tax=Edaphosphingomonas laterariae TaxID=861865 RepID=A0A239BNE3_9SPHN|nr:SDR family NAD(P)-dependent oxidoreductase [Sphingomonas laterariae]SNS08603.1 NAD(P)-dependent dehydrogenase, short-chain alcohol dehydrogenase family [Sphingomonas laterariae]
MADKVAVVTGASRGAGAGIARALGAAGYKVYVTGRTTAEGTAEFPGTIHSVAKEIQDAGGEAVAVAVDHAKDEQVEALFKQIEAEEGRLDILVNNVAHIHPELITPGGYWERPLGLVDILNVGLRSQYVASFYATPLMMKTGGALIAFTSSFGSVCYMHGPAYGAQKAGVDKFAADMGVDLKDHDVAAVSVWMGPLVTERTRRAADERPDQYTEFLKIGESPEFTGKVIAGIHQDPKRMELSGQTVIGAEQAQVYGIQDNGKTPPSYREMLGEPRIPHPAIVR